MNAGIAGLCGIEDTEAKYFFDTQGHTRKDLGVLHNELVEQAHIMARKFVEDVKVGLSVD
ncbi:hypothetical protein ACEODM_25035 [Klebsiella oxytoca]|uniref:hypothetical protein n=1 Tax=Klebsiella oxytoca TaxID=571 RepID=UPI00357135BE